jgi:hypothetical protein
MSFIVTHKATGRTTLLRKSLLTSLFQREALSPSFPHSDGFAEAKAKRGEGTRLPSVGQGFYDICILAYDLLSISKFGRFNRPHG